MIYQIDYNEFRDMINFWLDKNLSTVVFKKKKIENGLLNTILRFT